MGKGFGVAGLSIALIAFFVPFYGFFFSFIAIVFVTIAALAGDRVFATATPLITFVNSVFLSPVAWMFLHDELSPFLYNATLPAIVVATVIPFVGMALSSTGRPLQWPTYSQKQTIAKIWSDYGTYIIVAAVLIPVCILKGPLWIEYVRQKWNTHDGSSTVPTIPVDIGPTTQMLLGTAGRVAGIRIVTADQIPKTIQPGGPTAVGNDVQNGMHYVCYLADVSTCEAAFKQEANLERAGAGNGSRSEVTTGQQVQIPQAQVPTVEVPTENTPTPPPQQNAWNNPVEPPPYQAPPTPQVEETHWDHNGSSLKLESNGASRRFYYIEPRIGLIEVGVAQGMVAFEGTQSGNIYTGTAYVFSKVCGAIGYPVNGFVGQDQRSITLSGIAPYVDTQCRRAGEHQAVLVFQQTD
jgi:hypothetical protein